MHVNNRCGVFADNMHLQHQPKVLPDKLAMM